MADRLPLEIVEKIFRYLKLSDRLVASTVCSNWYEASLTFYLWRDVTLVIENSIDDASKLLKSTRKPIQHVKIKDVNFSSSNQGQFTFWNHISPHLLSLEIHNSYVSEANLLNLLLPCCSLESLHFHDCRDIFITGKLFSNRLVLTHIKSAVPNLRELCFADNCSYLSDSFLGRFMSIVAGLRYLSFAGTVVSFHPGIHKRFYPASRENDEENKSSELVLTFDYILEHIGHQASSVESLDFSRTKLDDKSCILLAKIPNLKLSTLLLRCCEVGSAGIAALSSSQNTLVELDLSYCARITDTAMESICSGLPNLTKLSLQGCRALTDTGIAFLCRLTRVQDINLQGLERITSSGVYTGLLSEKNSVLKRINLSATQITEETLYHLAQSTPFLTHLDLTSCVRAVSTLSLKYALKSLQKLRELRLDWCVSLTDGCFFGDLSEELTAPESLEQSFQEVSLASTNRPEETHEQVSDLVKISDIGALVHLSISGCNKITDRSLQLAFGFRDLRHLDLNGCSLITDSGLIALSDQNRGLEVLFLNNCSKISDDAIIKALACLARLRKLGLLGCLRLTNKTLQAIAFKDRLKYLSYLDISHCKLMSLDWAFQLQLQKPSLRELISSGLE